MYLFLDILYMLCNIFLVYILALSLGRFGSYLCLLSGIHFLGNLVLCQDNMPLVENCPYSDELSA